MKLNAFQKILNQESPYDFSGLSAIFLNCTLKKSLELSHTEGLIQMSQIIMEANGVDTEIIRPVDKKIAFGVYPEMTWNLMHLGDMLRKQGIPAYGNQRNTWDKRKNKDNPNPE